MICLSLCLVCARIHVSRTPRSSAFRSLSSLSVSPSLSEPSRVSPLCWYIPVSQSLHKTPFGLAVHPRGPSRPSRPPSNNEQQHNKKIETSHGAAPHTFLVDLRHENHHGVRRILVTLGAVGPLPTQQTPAVLHHHALEPQAHPEQRFPRLSRPPE